MDNMIKSFNERHQNKNYFQLINDISDEVTHLDNTKIDYETTKYHKHIGDFLFFLKIGKEPSGIKADGLKLFLPIINNLVLSGLNIDDDLKSKLYS